MKKPRSTEQIMGLLRRLQVARRARQQHPEAVEQLIPHRHVAIAWCVAAWLAAVTSAAEPIHVVVWDERQPTQNQAYENFLGNAIAAHLEGLPGVAVRSVGIDDGECGLSPAILDFADVLVWWGHVRHADIKEDVGRAIVSRIKDQGLTPAADVRKFPDGRVQVRLHLPNCCIPAYHNDGQPSQFRVL